MRSRYAVKGPHTLNTYCVRRTQDKVCHVAHPTSRLMSDRQGFEKYTTEYNHRATLRRRAVAQWPV